MEWKHSKLVLNETKTFRTCLQGNGSIHNLFRIKWKQLQLVWNEIEKFITSLELNGNTHN